MTVQTIRPPAVAGLFYPADAAALRAEVSTLLAQAADAESHPAPKALIAPHAGYAYSGPTAAQAFARMAPLRNEIRRVILLGPSHRVAFTGAALPEADHFATPLGSVALDSAAIAWLSEQPEIIADDAIHAQEHALEVLLPFLQVVLREFSIVPLALGRIAATKVAAWLDHLWGSSETLIVASSDLSHYNPYPVAQTQDQRTVEAMLALRPNVAASAACGATAVNALLIAAQRHGCTGSLLDLCNSGDRSADRKRVVGYAAIGFTLPSNTLQ